MPKRSSACRRQQNPTSARLVVVHDVHVEVAVLVGHLDTVSRRIRPRLGIAALGPRAAHLHPLVPRAVEAQAASRARAARLAMVIKAPRFEEVEVRARGPRRRIGRPAV